MDLFEYQARDLFEKHGVPVLPGIVAETPAEARAAAEKLGTPVVVVKAQVKTGGRGKAGGVKVVKLPEEAEQAAEQILGMDIKGHTVHRVMVAAGASIAEEYYFSLLLDRAIQDVLGQTHQDWQLMIVNDCGDPAPVHALVERWAHEAHGRIRVLDRTSSAGMESASNAGIEATASEFIAIHDDDDTWHPAFLQQTVTHLRAHPEHAAVSVRTEIVHERIVPSPTGGERVVDDWRHVVWPRMGALHLSEFLAVNRMVPISVLHRRTVHEDVGMFREDLPVVGDYAFHLELLKRHQLGFIQRPLAEWRLRPAASGAASNSMFAQKDAHRQWDRELTEPAIRSWLDREGLGEALYMSRMVEEQLERALEHVHRENCELREQLDHTNRQLDEVLGILKGRGPRAVVRRVGRRVLGR